MIWFYFFKRNGLIYFLPIFLYGFRINYITRINYIINKNNDSKLKEIIEKENLVREKGNIEFFSENYQVYYLNPYKNIGKK